MGGGGGWVINAIYFRQHADRPMVRGTYSYNREKGTYNGHFTVSQSPKLLVKPLIIYNF